VDEGVQVVWRSSGLGGKGSVKRGRKWGRANRKTGK
jgi:hypothetical protein